MIVRDRDAGATRKLRAREADAAAEEGDRAGDDAHGRRLRLLRLQRPRSRRQHPRGHEHQHRGPQQHVKLAGESQQV